MVSGGGCCADGSLCLGLWRQGGHAFVLFLAVDCWRQGLDRIGFWTNERLEQHPQQGRESTKRSCRVIHESSNFERADLHHSHHHSSL